jgi:molecular chaperone GrpE (heat shock protein)
MKLPAPVENLLQRFRREQREDQTVVMRLRGEIDRLKREQSTLQEESLRRAYQTLFADASSPVSQLLLQVHLANNANSSLTADDVLANVKRLVAILEQHGLTVVGQPDEIQKFDPNIHEPMNERSQPALSEQVCIRFPGISYQGQVLRKAAVDPLEYK